MASIDRRSLAAYRQALDKVCSGAGSAATRALEQWLSANPGATVEEIREAAIELIDAILGSYGDAASSLACDLFDTVMEAEGVAVPAAQVYGFREGAVEGTVRRIVGDVDGTQGSLDAFVQAVGQFAENETRRAASTTVEKNVERAAKTKAGRNVRYARVPTSPVPCEWCAMLASRGFVYRSSESAEATRHHDCTCTIVPGIKGKTQVAGYNPDHYYDVWKNRERYEDANKTSLTVPQKSRTEVFFGNLKDAITDSRLFAVASGGYEWAARVAQAEVDLLTWVEKGYPSARDHNGKQAILVLSSRGEIIVGATALSHIDLDHPSEGGRAGVTIRGIIDSIENPLGATAVVYDDFGRPSYKLVSLLITSAVNPETLEVVTAWPTRPSDFTSIGL